MLTNPYEIAIHEAGHATMCVLFHRGFRYITIVPKGIYAGHCRLFPAFLFDSSWAKEKRKFRLERECLVDLAGVIAEYIILHRPYKEAKKGSSRDIEMAFALIDEVTGSYKEYQEYCERLVIKAKEMFSDPLVQAQIKAVADALMDKQRLSGTKVRSIMKSIAAQQVA